MEVFTWRPVAKATAKVSSSIGFCAQLWRQRQRHSFLCLCRSSVWMSLNSFTNCMLAFIIGKYLVFPFQWKSFILNQFSVCEHTYQVVNISPNNKNIRKRHNDKWAFGWKTRSLNSEWCGTLIVECVICTSHLILTFFQLENYPFKFQNMFRYCSHI